MIEQLAGRVAVITGAGGGLGREFARLAARSRMRLVLADVQPDALQTTVQLCLLIAAGALAYSAAVATVGRGELRTITAAFRS